MFCHICLDKGRRKESQEIRLQISTPGYMSVHYHGVFPQNQKATYGHGELIHLVLSFPGEMLVPGSVALVGRVACYSTGTTAIAAGDQIYRDPLAGNHALFSSIKTSAQNFGGIESFQDYPRFVKMLGDATADNVGVVVETPTAAQGMANNAMQTQGMMMGMEGGADVTVIGGGEPFCVIPQICLNNCDGLIRDDVFGSLDMEVTTAYANQYFWGAGATAACNFKITDLKCYYQTVPIPPGSKPTPVHMTTYAPIQKNLNSNVCNLDCFVSTGLADAVHISFCRQADLGDVTKNYLQTAAPPGTPVYPGSLTGIANYGIARIEWAVNDTETALVGFPFDSQEDILMNWLRSFNVRPDRFSSTLGKLRGGPLATADGYGIGIPFGGLIDFRQTKFGVLLYSDVLTTDPFTAFLYFRSYITF
jgi:hypothetical protein